MTAKTAAEMLEEFIKIKGEYEMTRQTRIDPECMNALNNTCKPNN